MKRILVALAFLPVFLATAVYGAPTKATGDELLAREDVPLVTPESVFLANDLGDLPLSIIGVNSGIAGNNDPLPSAPTSRGGTVQWDPVARTVTYLSPPDNLSPSSSQVDSFIYVMRDSGGAEDKGQVTLYVLYVNDPPVATNDLANGVEDVPMTFNKNSLVQNDYEGAPDETEQALDVAGVLATTEKGGTAVLNPDGTINYTPPLDYNYLIDGPDILYYLVYDDGQSEGLNPNPPPSYQFTNDFKTNTGMVLITLTEVNDPPVVVNDTLYPTEDIPFSVPISQILANDKGGPDTALDEATQTLTLFSFGTTTARGGTVQQVGNMLVYTPLPNFNGLDFFVYTIEDNGTTDGTPDPKRGSGRVFLEVIPVDDVRPYYFIGVSNYPAGVGPISLATADFNLGGFDTFTDLVVANYLTNHITILAGNGDGVLEPWGIINTRTNPAAVATADFNADAEPDIAVVSETDGVLSIIHGDFNQGFVPGPEFAVGARPLHVVAAELDGVNGPDLVVAVAGDSKLEVLLNDGAGSFTSASYAVAGMPVFLAVDDINNDFRPDLVVAQSNNNAVAVFTNNSASPGTFVKLNTDLTVGTRPVGVSLADFDNNGRLDLAVANAGANGISTYLGAGNGQFLFSSNYFIGLRPSAILAKDFNHDNKVDLVTAHRGDNNIVVLPGGGSGVFSNFYYEAGTVYTVGSEPVALVAGDFNSVRDLDPDLAVANFGSGTVSLLLNSTRPRAYSSTVYVYENTTTNIVMQAWGAPLEYRVVIPPVKGTYTQNGTGPVLTYRPRLGAFGADRIGFYVTDSVNVTPIAYVNIIILAINDPPSFDLLTNLVIIPEDWGYTNILGFATNISKGGPEERGQIIKFITTGVLDSLHNNTYLFDIEPRIYSSGQFVAKPAKNAYGLINCTTILKDNGGTANGGNDTSEPKDFRVWVTNVNDAPVVSPRFVYAKFLWEDNPWTYTLGLQDLETPVEQLQFEVTSTNHALVGPEDMNIQLVGSNYVVNVTPKADQHGRTLLTFNTRDGTNTTTRTGLFWILPYNDQPSFALSTSEITWPATGGWYTNDNILAWTSKGPPNESYQLLIYQIVNTNITLFSALPWIDYRNGQLRFRPRGTAYTGTVNLDVYVRDTGGGTNNTFGPLPLRINITP